MKSAILTLEEAILRFGRDKRNGRRVVFTNGCFDLLHPGHIRGLENARKLGDVLIIGLNSDASVRQLKGHTRPVIPERERAEILAALECVDAVVIFDDLTPREVISRLLPDVLVKGGDWPGDQIVGRAEVEAAGGRVVSIPVVPGYSTSLILEKIRKGSGKEPHTEGSGKEPHTKGRREQSSPEGSGKEPHTEGFGKKPHTKAARTSRLES